MEYVEVEKRFMDYVLTCKKIIKEVLFEEDYSVREDLIVNLKIDKNISMSNAIRYHKNEMIDIKLNHTMRIVGDVEKMSMKMNTPVNFSKVVKVAALLHDIARFDQAIFSNSFNDKACKEFNGEGHAEYGYKLLYVNKRINGFDIPNKYTFAIAKTVQQHQIPILTGDLALRMNCTQDLDVDKYLTGRQDLNDSEKIIVATLVQMVKDVDMLDILYQHLTGEFPVVRPSVVYDVLNDSLKDISIQWGISSKEIAEYNGLINDDISECATLKIPVANVDSKKLSVPKDIQIRFFNNENLDLKELQNRRDWTFITGMWWRLNHFLNNINFTSNLEILEENRLLDSIYNTYPEEYKPLVIDAFTYAKEYLLEHKIRENKNYIYTQKKH